MPLHEVRQRWLAVDAEGVAFGNREVFDLAIFVQEPFANFLGISFPAERLRLRHGRRFIPVGVLPDLGDSRRDQEFDRLLIRRTDDLKAERSEHVLGFDDRKLLVPLLPSTCSTTASAWSRAVSSASSRFCLVRFQGFQRLGGVLDELIDERRLAVDELLDLIFREPARGQCLHEGSALSSAGEQSVLLEDGVYFGRSEGL